MIRIEEIPTDQLDAFWEMHYAYLLQDGIISDAEDRAYFKSDEYRGAIRRNMGRSTDRHHLIYFTDGGQRLGAASYYTSQGEGGKCFILDFWVFPGFRGRGIGHRCFDALKEYAAGEGATHYQLNCDGRADRMRFWESNGFTEDGKDEYGIPLLTKR